MALLGVDVGGTRLKAGLVDGQGRMIRHLEAATPLALEPFCQALRRLVEGLTQTGAALSAAGVGCKGIINPETTRVERLPGAWNFLEGRLLADLLRPALPPGVPVAADNDARAAMAGEMTWGAARGRRNAILLTLGTGVGGAILAEGRLLRGVLGAAGHLGHVNVEADGLPCVCGAYGCLETRFSAGAIEAEALSVARRGLDSELTRIFSRDPRELTCRAVFHAAAAGDLQARGVVDRAIRILGAALAGLVHVFDPEVVILGGQVAEAGRPLFDPLREEVDRRTRPMLGRSVPIVSPGVADTSGVVGAAALAIAGQTGARRTIS